MFSIKKSFFSITLKPDTDSVRGMQLVQLALNFLEFLLRFKQKCMALGICG